MLAVINVIIKFADSEVVGLYSCCVVRRVYIYLASISTNTIELYEAIFYDFKITAEILRVLGLHRLLVKVIK